MSEEAKTLLNLPVPLSFAPSPSKKSGQLRNCTDEPIPTISKYSFSRAISPPNFIACAPLTRLNVSLREKVFCV